VHVPAVHVPTSQGLPLLHPPGHDPPPLSDPNPSWHVTVAPEFMTICLAAIAPTNFAVLIVTSAFVATTSA
jgi:hypothetical protein